MLEANDSVAMSSSCVYMSASISPRDHRVRAGGGGDSESLAAPLAALAALAADDSDSAHVPKARATGWHDSPLLR